MPRGDLLSWKAATSGSVISVTASSTTTIRSRGAFIETLKRSDGTTPLQFDGLWDLLPQDAGVFFTAGIADEGHGLFGLITED